MSFGDRLKKIRQSHHFTQTEMSKKLHMEQSNYSKYENNKAVPAAHIINRICSEFKVSADWLLCSEPETDSLLKENKKSNLTVTQSEHYYYVPKKLLDAYLKQQQLLESLLEKTFKKLQ